MAEARAGDRRIKEIELSRMLAEIAEKRGRPEQAIAHLEKAISIAKAGQVQRLLAEAESDLADAYRARGDLTQALRYATAAVADTTAAGSRFTLPGRMRVLAEIYAAQDRVADANRVYDQAADIVEGIMVNVPSREAQARLVGRDERALCRALSTGRGPTQRSRQGVRHHRASEGTGGCRCSARPAG